MVSAHAAEGRHEQLRDRLERGVESVRDLHQLIVGERWQLRRRPLCTREERARAARDAALPDERARREELERCARFERLAARRDLQDACRRERRERGEDVVGREVDVLDEEPQPLLDRLVQDALLPHELGGGLRRNVRAEELAAVALVSEVHAHQLVPRQLSEELDQRRLPGARPPFHERREGERDAPCQRREVCLCARCDDRLCGLCGLVWTTLEAHAVDIDDRRCRDACSKPPRCLSSAEQPLLRLSADEPFERCSLHCPHDLLEDCGARAGGVVARDEEERDEPGERQHAAHTRHRPECVEETQQLCLVRADRTHRLRCGTSEMLFEDAEVSIIIQDS